MSAATAACCQHILTQLSSAAQGASKLNMDPPKPEKSPGLPRQVVYVPSCVTRMMGPSRSDSETASVHEKLLSLFAKAGYEVIYPEVRPGRSTRLWHALCLALKS